MEEKQAVMTQEFSEKEKAYQVLLDDAIKVCDSNMTLLSTNLPILADLVKNSDK